MAAAAGRYRHNGFGEGSHRDRLWAEGGGNAHTCTRSGAQPILTRHGGCLCCAIDGGLVVYSCTEHRAPSNRRRARRPATGDVHVRVRCSDSPMSILFAEKNRYICSIYTSKDFCLVLRRFLRRQTMANTRKVWMFLPWSVRAVGG